MRIIDLSKPIRYNRYDPFFMQVKVKPKPRWMARLLVRALGLPFKLMPKDFSGWADDTITKMGVHATTHIDAPWHYGPESEGKPAQTIEQIPLERCLGPGVVFDMTQLEFVDSSGLGAILSCVRQLSARGGELKLCGLSKGVRALLELVRMHRVVEIHNDVDEAVAAF